MIRQHEDRKDGLTVQGCLKCSGLPEGMLVATGVCCAGKHRLCVVWPLFLWGEGLKDQDDGAEGNQNPDCDYRHNC
jgi:hypothetical protein